MRITGKLTAQEVKQVRRIVWAPNYWLNLFNNYMWPRFFLLTGLIILGAVLTAWIAQYTGVNSKVAGFAIGAVGILCLAYLLFRWHQLPQKVLKKMNDVCPEIIEITGDGITMTQTDCISTAMPWSVIKSWRAGSRALVIDFAKDANLLVFPLTQLAAVDQDIIRDMLRLHLGAPAFVLSERVAEEED